MPHKQRFPPPAPTAWGRHCRRSRPGAKFLWDPSGSPSQCRYGFGWKLNVARGWAHVHLASSLGNSQVFCSRRLRPHPPRNKTRLISPRFPGFPVCRKALACSGSPWPEQSSLQSTKARRPLRSPLRISWEDHGGHPANDAAAGAAAAAGCICTPDGGAVHAAVQGAPPSRLCRPPICCMLDLHPCGSCCSAALCHGKLRASLRLCAVASRPALQLS